jgi:hypothetical protein
LSEIFYSNLYGMCGNLPDPITREAISIQDRQRSLDRCGVFRMIARGRIGLGHPMTQRHASAFLVKVARQRRNRLPIDLRHKEQSVYD